jgi:hypothetical protein
VKLTAIAGTCICTPYLSFSILHSVKVLPHLFHQSKIRNVRFEVLTAVTMKNGVLWYVTPGGSCNNRRFGGT